MTALPPPLRIEPRWTDLDPVGHVNNNVFLVYAEEARARYLMATLPDAWGQIVVVHNGIDYHSPVEISDVVCVTSIVESIGTSSLTTVNVIATHEGRKCATVRTVQVVLHSDRRGSRPWTEDERAALLTLVEDPADR
ncbi:esterase [Mycobacterium sp. E342]|uniref:acyl-CoA thioesterase n=1 Tax=unclassified Mycobacterium TaxID=2642494 RepID=UPI000800254A|nr:MULTISPECIES: thioesterase family protein [unclassified Mycobacterium]OBH01657.1 esterase [Mycobacterium sp. E3247]OBH31498.1 esterase [Mycobacterium sp. E342]